MGLLVMGLLVACAQPHEARLAEPTLQAVGAPQPHGRLKTRPKNRWETKPMAMQTLP